MYCVLWYIVKIYGNLNMFQELYIGFTFDWSKGCTDDSNLLFADVKNPKKDTAGMAILISAVPSNNIQVLTVSSYVVTMSPPFT